MLLEDSRRYHGIRHGWATDDPRDWENAIALRVATVLRQELRAHSLTLRETIMTGSVMTSSRPLRRKSSAGGSGCQTGNRWLLQPRLGSG